MINIGVLKDLTGQKFGDLQVLKRAESYISPKGAIITRWECVCSCGATVIRSSSELKGKHNLCRHIHSGKYGQRNTYKIGERYQNQNGLWFTIVGYDENNSRRRKIRFDDGCELNALTSQIRNKKLRSYNEKTFFGVACLGGLNLTNHPLYYRWLNMIGRCYSENHCAYKSYGEKGVYVSDELLNFSNYIKIVEKLPRYDLLMKNPELWEIDKDLKSKDEKVYSKDTICIMRRDKNLDLENSSKRIKVQQFSMDGEYINTFDSMTVAAKETGVWAGNIAHCVRGDRLSAGGYIWRNYYDTAF